MIPHEKFETVRNIALSLPAVEEGLSYGTTAFRVNGKLFVRIHQDGESLVLKVDFEDREFLLGHNPNVFYITDHYQNYPTVLIRLSAVDNNELQEYIELAWLRCASKRLVAEYSRKHTEMFNKEL